MSIKGIQSQPRTLRQLFENRLFAIDLYQRDYTWSRDHLAKLIEDLSAAFERMREARQRGYAVSPYFLGAIILQSRESADYIIDGQQRITTLLLLFMRLARELDKRPPGKELEDLIFREGPTGAFFLQVEEYAQALDEIWKFGTVMKKGASDAERRLNERYVELDELFTDEFDGAATAAFTRWLLDDVVIVEISTEDGAVSYQMFETMNNRGEPIRPADLFRHYLLARITDPAKRESANDSWSVEARELQRLGPGEDLVALRTVLQARYALSSKDQTTPSDGSLHAWSPDSAINDALGGKVDFARFLGGDLVFYGRWYRKFRMGSAQYVKDLEPLFFAARTGAPHMYRILLAPLNPEEDEALSWRKAKLSTTFLDILCARLAWNPKFRRRQKFRNDLLILVEESRDLSPDQLALYYASKLESLVPKFHENESSSLEHARRTDIHSILARMASYLVFQLEGQDHYPEYEQRSGRKAWDVESIIAPDKRHDKTSLQSKYEDMNTHIGGLILAPKSLLKAIPNDDTASRIGGVSDSHVLNAVLSTSGYTDSRLTALNTTLSTPFQAFNVPVTPEDLDHRRSALLALAERIWDPARLVHVGQAG